MAWMPSKSSEGVLPLVELIGKTWWWWWWWWRVQLVVDLIFSKSKLRALHPSGLWEICQEMPDVDEETRRNIAAVRTLVSLTCVKTGDLSPLKKQNNKTEKQQNLVSHRLASWTRICHRHSVVEVIDCHHQVTMVSTIDDSNSLRWRGLMDVDVALDEIKSKPSGQDWLIFVNLVRDKKHTWYEYYWKLIAFLCLQRNKCWQLESDIRLGKPRNSHRTYEDFWLRRLRIQSSNIKGVADRIQASLAFSLQRWVGWFCSARCGAGKIGFWWRRNFEVRDLSTFAKNHETAAFFSPALALAMMQWCNELHIEALFLVENWRPWRSTTVARWSHASCRPASLIFDFASYFVCKK